MPESTEEINKKKILSELKSDIEKMESEKAAITDWRIREEKKVDAAKAEIVKINNEISKKKSDLEAENKKISDLIAQLRIEESNLARSRGENQYEIARLEEMKTENNKNFNAVNESKKSLDARESELVKREKFIKAIFEGLDALKGK